MTTTEHQRAVKAAAGELIDVSFTVNGTPVTIRVPARMHLADALRQHLGLSQEIIDLLQPFFDFSYPVTHLSHAD